MSFTLRESKDGNCNPQKQRIQFKTQFKTKDKTMTLEIWRRKISLPGWTELHPEPEIIISAPSAAIVIMAVIEFTCFDTKRYIWKVR